MTMAWQEDAVQFAKNLKNRRKKLELTQGELAERMVDKGFAGCDARTIWRWEHIKEDGVGLPSYAKMCALADCLGVDVAHLLGAMKGERYEEQDAADYLGLDPAAVQALVLLRPEHGGENDDGVRVEHGSRTMSLLILDVMAATLDAHGGTSSHILQDYSRLARAAEDWRMMDTPEEAARERERVEREVRAARFELVESFGTMFRERYAVPASDEDCLSDKGRAVAERMEAERRAHDCELVKRLENSAGNPEALTRNVERAISALSQVFSACADGLEALRSRFDEASRRLRREIR